MTTNAESAADVARLFSGYRLQVAREAQGLSRSALSRLIGVTAPAVSQFERGQVKPKATTVDNIARELRFPVGFFSTATLVVDTSQADEDRMDYYGHFRSLRSVSVTQRRQSLTAAHLLRDVVGVLERHVQLPALDLPKLLGANPAEAAAATREHMGLETGPIASVVYNLESHGILCARYPLQAEKVSALSVPASERTYIIFKQQESSKKDRDRFSGSHELGHLVMHEPNEVLADKATEVEANKFASEFLMPAAVIEDELPARVDWPRFIALKQRWGVSLSALLMRSRDLGKMPQSTYVQAMKTINARGWRVNEPGDLGPTEVPQLLKQAVDVSGLPLTDIARECGWPVDMVDALLTGAEDTRPKVTL